jgi:predicted transcriptional regulator of viral defense system
MAYIENLYKLKIFRKQDIVALTGSENAAKELLRQYKKQGLISQIRRDLYSANDLDTKTSLVSKFEIAGNITPTSYLSHHAAMEYYGVANQVFYEIYVSSVESFRNFDFEGITYTFCKSPTEMGVVNPVADSRVRITDLERTIIDCIHRINLCGGLEELVQCLSSITYVKETKLLECLAAFDKQILYQKTGFILSYFQKEMRLSDDFFSVCKSKIGKSTGYLTDKTESDTYFKNWKLCAPENILAFLEQGGHEYV